MQTERVTILMTPAKKAALVERAAAHHKSIGQYVRRKVEDEDDLTPEQEVLVAEVNKAVARMIEQLDAISATLQATHEHVERTLRQRASANERRRWRFLRFEKYRAHSGRVDVMQRDIARISTDVASVNDYARAIDLRVSTIEGYLRGRSEGAAQASQPRIEG